MLFGAFGCNLVGGVIYAVLDLMACLAERAKEAAAARPRLTGRDWVGALGIFLWVFLITFPVTIPFIFVRTVGLRPGWTGLVMVLLGAGLVAATIALGG